MGSETSAKQKHIETASQVILPVMDSGADVQLCRFDRNDEILTQGLNSRRHTKQRHRKNKFQVALLTTNSRTDVKLDIFDHNNKTLNR